MVLDAEHNQDQIVAPISASPSSHPCRESPPSQARVIKQASWCCCWACGYWYIDILLYWYIDFEKWHWYRLVNFSWSTVMVIRKRMAFLAFLSCLCFLLGVTLRVFDGSDFFRESLWLKSDPPSADNHYTKANLKPHSNMVYICDL